MRTVVAAACVSLLLGQPVAAEVRAFAAIQYMALDAPAPGAEKIHADLSRALRGWRRLAASADAVPDKWRRQFARCAVRTDVPAPSVFALECADVDGTYIGTKRFTSARGWREWLLRQLSVPHSDARPLHTTKSVQVEMYGRRFADDRHGFRGYVEGLLRAGGLTVVTSTDALSAEDRERGFLTCSIRPLVGGSGGDLFQTTSQSSIVMIDSAGRTVRHFIGSTGTFLKLEGALGRDGLRAAVEQFLEEWREDADIYDPRTRISRP
jgi:hypothetical protein